MSDDRLEDEDVEEHPEREERIERAVSLLRELRGRITADPPLPFDEWELQLYAYDEALVTAADIFDIDVPAAARDEMGPDDRAHLEQALTDAGVDLTGGA